MPLSETKQKHTIGDDEKLVREYFDVSPRWNKFKNNRLAFVSLIIITILIILVLVGPFFIPFSIEDLDWDNILSPPSLSNGHWFGTDSLGRDLLLRVLIGARISLLIGFSGALVAVIIGTIYGSTSGFVGGIVDTLMMRVLEILQSFPFVFLVILMIAFLGNSFFLVFLAIGFVSWIDIARIVRGQTHSLKNLAFIDAAKLCGTGTYGVIYRHIIPNLFGVVCIYASLLVPQMILFESFLSFLGLGVQEPLTSWGALVNDGAQNMEIAIWLFLFPIGFLSVTLFCLNFIGDGLRDLLDSRLH